MARKRRAGKQKLPGRLERGPPKERREKAHQPRASSHKRRSVWFQARASWPFREAPVEALVQERARVRKTLPPLAGRARWEPAGPTNIGGRLTSLVSDPTQPDRLWAGSAGGGVFESEDAGKSWVSLWHKQSSLNIGSLALDPTDPQVIYCGTGEANLSADSYAGVGLFRSQNGGRSWQLWAPSQTTPVPSRIGAIAIDPFDPTHLRVGGIGYPNGKPGGMCASRDGGRTWVRETFISAENHWCHSIVFHPRRKGIVFAAFTERGARSGIWQSRDGGKSWSQLRDGLPGGAEMGRTTLAIAPSSPDVVYALSADTREGVLGVFRSADGGKSWKRAGGDHFQDETQMSYNNTIAVHPTDPDRVICGGVDLHLSTDGGKHWKQVTRWDARRGERGYAHADHHALVMPAAAPGRIYDANDGGMDLSLDGGLSWSNRSSGLPVTMYYDLDVAPSDGRSFGGGTQDNGTVVTTTGRPDDFMEILGGDGGWMVYDPHDALHLYASYYNMHIFRHRGRAWTDVSPPASDREREMMWMVFIAMDPSNPSVVFTASSRVFRTRNDGAAWSAVSPVLDESPISAIEVAPRNPRFVYVGTENGGFFRSRDGGDTWSPNLAGATLPGRIITRIETSPLDADLLFVTVAGFGQSHLFRSRDGGVSWEDVDRRRLPDVPHHAVVIPPDSPQTVYVAGDAGVFVSQNLGETWMDLTRNLPTVMVVDLVHHLKDRTLSAATYGRSLWRISLR